MKYMVNIPFKYGGKVYDRGDTWEPQGYKFDKDIVRMRNVTPFDEPQKRRRTKKAPPKE